MLVIPYSYSPERFGVFSPVLYARQFYDLVNEYVLSAIFGQWELLNLCIKQIFLKFSFGSLPIACAKSVIFAIGSKKRWFSLLR